MSGSTDRSVLGLDLFRATGVLLVMFAHYANNYAFWLGWQFPTELSALGGLGVDVFFVLSGFLIGRLLLDIAERAPSLENLRIFLVRRWMRTLPLYYMWLAVLIVIFPNHLVTSWPFLIMMQNFAWPMPSADYFYSISWSLTIEEWFYLFFGSAVIGGAIVAPLRKVLLVVLAAFLIVPLMIRLGSPSTWQIQFAVIGRLDAIAYGVLMALLFRWKSRIFGAPVFEVLGLLIGASLICLQLAQAAPVPSWAGDALADNFFCVGAALCLPAALKMQVAPRLVAAPIQLISRISYGLYIMHSTFLVDIVQPMWLRQELTTLQAMSLAIILPFVFAYLSHRYFESWWMRRRPLQRFPDRETFTARPVLLRSLHGSLAMAVLQVSIIGAVAIVGSVAQLKADRSPQMQAARAARTASNPIGALFSVKDGDSSTLRERAELNGFQQVDAALLGSIDAFEVDSNEVRTAGWVLDRSGGDPAPSILFFVDGRFIGSVVPNLRRPDVFVHYKLNQTTKSVGFRVSLNFDACKPGSEREAVIVSGKRIALIPAQKIVCASEAASLLK